MKTKILILTCLLLAVNLQASTLWRVSSDKSLKPHYSNFQHAIDSCEVGDTIYVYPGNYGSVEIKKKLTILGVGYFIAENAKDTLISFASTSHLDNITFSAGSDFSLMSGLEVGGNINCTTANNITISGNKYGGIGLTNSNYLIIKKNYGGGISGTNCLNTLISNNILGDINLDIYSNAYIQYNHTQSRISVFNSNIINNINYYGSHYYPNMLSNCQVMNNISYEGWDSNKGNIQIGNLNEVYPNGVTADNYKLQQNSIAKGKGTGSTDCGPFGGDDPYCLSGLNYIPSIAKLSMPVTITGSNGLPVKVIVRSNR